MITIEVNNATYAYGLPTAAAVAQNLAGDTTGTDELWLVSPDGLTMQKQVGDATTLKDQAIYRLLPAFTVTPVAPPAPASAPAPAGS